MFRWFILALSVLFITANSTAQQLPKIDYEKYTLSNGLQVILCVNKKIPAVNVNLWYHVGSKNEKPGKTGFAHLFEHMMFQGSKHVVGEYLQLAEQAGANLRTGGVNGTTNNDRTNYFETVPSTSLEYALWLESDRMGFLDDALTEEKFTNQQDVVKNEKRQGDNSPYSAVKYLVADNLYPAGHPYAHTVIGSIEDLTNATLDDVKDFFNTWYVPNNCTLTLVGDFDPAHAKELVHKYFGPLAPGKPLSRPGVNIPTLNRNKQVMAKDRVPMAMLQLVYPTPPMFSKEEAPLDFAASILGHGKTSYLNRRLVRDLQLANSVRISNSCREISGEFTITVVARPGADLEKIKTIVDEEMASFLAKGPTEEEMQRIRSEMAMGFLRGLERIGGFGGIADRLNSYNTFLGEPDYFQKDFDRYQNVKAEDVVSTFRKWIADAHRLEIYITPETSGRPDAEEFDRTVIPSTDGQLSFKAPETQRSTLDNGLEIVVTPRPDLPVVSTSLMIKTQDVLETAEKAGRSSLTAAIMDEGTTSRDALQLQRDLDQYGSSLRVNGSKFSAGVTLSSLAKNLKPSFAIMADVVLHPAMDEEEFARLQKRSLDGLKRRMSDPGSIANNIAMRMLFGENHPLGRNSSGTESSINALTTSDLRETWEQFWRPNNAVLMFVGDITMDEARDLASEYLGAWEKGAIPDVTMPPATAPAEQTVYLVDKQGAPQSQVRICSVAPERQTPDYYALNLANGLLGGAFSSRLNLNIREDKGYAYGAFCHMVNAKDYGYWSAMAGVQTKFTPEALVEFRKEIEGISGSIPVTQTELEGMQKNLSRGYVQNFESNDMVLGQITHVLAMGLPIDDLDRYIPAIEKQTPSTVTSAAKKYFNFPHAITVVVGDLAEIEQGIRALNWGNVVVVDAEGNVLR
ncbi:insulinase family protein [bacterium]|nr:insulinase family protein [bacterium]